MPCSVLADIWMPSFEDVSRLGPLWTLVGTIAAILIGALIVGRNWRVAGGIAIVGCLATAWVCLRCSASLDGNWAGLSPDAGAPMLVADQFSYFFIFLVSIFLVLIAGMWFLGQDAGLPERLSRKRDATEFFVLLVGSAFGMSLMVSTTNLLMILLAVEMTSLPSYGLAGFRKKHPLAAEASLKYILFGAVTSAIMIYGASLLYGQYHTLDLATIGQAIGSRAAGTGSTVLMGVSLVAFMVGVAFKVSAVPFHFWCPDVFEGASIEITTWLSVASKAAGLGLLLRIIAIITSPENYPPETLAHVTGAIAILAAITCTFGNFSAYRQTNLKRLLAFSSIAHAGYMLMAVAIIWHPTSSMSNTAHPAFSAIIVYITVYLLMNLGAFGCVAMVYWATGKETIDAFNGLIRRSPVVAVVMAVCLFSLVGLPPLGGFIAKWYLLLALYDGGLIWLVIVAVANTLISLYYYARIAYAMCFTDDGQPAIRTPVLGQIAVTVCAVAIILTGTLWAGTLKEFSDYRSRDLYAVGRQPAPVQLTEPVAEAAELEITDITK
ncbi:MAG: NADH-quinone oxidoreductase subunit N [Phycisphaerae bacterium]|nr:NADH-quinone oxidoreductase subunit N [Phycisphaerae bacterium]